MTQFVHLRLHTEYSLIDSIVRVEDASHKSPLMQAIADAGMPAVALTDQGNLFALVKFYKAALDAGIKPVTGVDLLVAEPGERRAPSRLTLLCQSQQGYRNVTQLVSRAYLEGRRNEAGTPMVERAWLTPDSMAGLIGLSCATEGDIGRAVLNGRDSDARAALQWWQERLGDRFYLEVQRVGREGEETWIAAAVALSQRQGVPLVATNDVRFLAQADFEVHEARV